jgi:D-hexose-6-phosphate mutarotase
MTSVNKTDVDKCNAAFCQNGNQVTELQITGTLLHYYFHTTHIDSVAHSGLVVKAPCYKLAGHGFDSRRGVIGIFQ